MIETIRVMETKFIIITGNHDDSTMMELHQKGMFSFHKPVILHPPGDHLLMESGLKLASNKSYLQ